MISITTNPEKPPAAVISINTNAAINAPVFKELPVNTLNKPAKARIWNGLIGLSLSWERLSLFECELVSSHGIMVVISRKLHPQSGDRRGRKRRLARASTKGAETNLPDLRGR